MDDWGRAVSRSGLPFAVKTLGLILATFAVDGVAAPGVEQLQVALRRGRTSISQYLAVLESAGYVRLVARGNRRKGEKDIWRLTIPDHVQPVEQ